MTKIKHFIDNHHTRVEVNRETIRGEDIDYKTDLTVPNQSLTIREIIDRFTTGRPIEGLRSTYYDQGDDLEPDPEILDLVDADAVQRELHERIKRDNLEDSQETDDQKKSDIEKTPEKQSADSGTDISKKQEGGEKTPEES